MRKLSRCRRECTVFVGYRLRRFRRRSRRLLFELASSLSAVGAERRLFDWLAVLSVTGLGAGGAGGAALGVVVLGAGALVRWRSAARAFSAALVASFCALARAEWMVCCASSWRAVLCQKGFCGLVCLVLRFGTCDFK